MERQHRMSGGQLLAAIIAVCIAVVAAPVGVLASTGSLVNITDPKHSSYKAHVTSAGALRMTGSVAVTKGQVNASTKPAGSAIARQLAQDSGTLSRTLSYKVPAGKTLWLTTIEVEAAVPSGHDVKAYLDIVPPGGTVCPCFDMPLSFYATSSGFDLFESIQDVQVPAAAGSIVRFQVQGTNNDAQAFTGAIAGYLTS